MWLTIGIVLVLLAWVYVGTYLMLFDNLTTMQEQLSIVQEVIDDVSFTSKDGIAVQSRINKVASIYRKSIPLVCITLFWRVGLYLRRECIISAYNVGNPELEWDLNPKLLEDLSRGFVPRDRSPSLGEMKAFARVLDRVLIP